MIKFRCPHCDQKIGLPEQYANRQVHCARCGQLLVVPAASTETDSADKSVVRFRCKACGQKLKVSQKRAGAKLNCPKCSAVIVIPSATGDSMLDASSSGSTISDELLESNVGTGDFLQELEELERAPVPQVEEPIQLQQASNAEVTGRRCPSCGAVHSADRKVCTLCGQALVDLVAEGLKRPGDELAVAGGSLGIDNMVAAILVSAGLAILGGIGWCVLAKCTGLNWVSFMALAVCCLAGGGFYLCTQSRSVGVGVLAALIGFMGILNGKTLIAKYVAMPQVKKFMSNTGGQFGKAFENHPMKDKFYEDMVKNEDLMFVMAAMQLAEEGQIEEELVEGIVMKPADANENPERAKKIEEAKVKIRKALKSWDKKKKKKVAEAQYPKLSQKYVNLFMESDVGRTFSFIGAWFWSFSCQDIVWLPLGVFCAYKIARGEE